MANAQQSKPVLFLLEQTLTNHPPCTLRHSSCTTISKGHVVLAGAKNVHILLFYSLFRSKRNQYAETFATTQAQK